MDFVLCSKGATKLFKYQLYELSHFEIKFSFPTIFVYTEKLKKYCHFWPTTPSFLPSTPLKSANCSSPPF